MRAQQSGSIVLTASVSGLTAWSHAAPYCATKAAVIQLAKVAAVEYARDGIRVNCVCPGTFRSGIHDELPEQAIDAIAAKHPLGLGHRRRPGRRVLVPRERRVALDDRVGDRRRRRLRRAVSRGRAADAPDMSWVGVLEHHARRTPDKPIAVDRRPRSSPTRRWLDRARGARGRARTRAGVGRRRRRRAALVQQHRVPRDDLRREPPRRDRDADQLAPRGARAAVHPRALRARARSCATRELVDLADEATDGLDDDLVRVARRRTRSTRAGSASPISRRGADRPAGRTSRATTSTG